MDFNPAVALGKWKIQSNNPWSFEVLPARGTGNFCGVFFFFLRFTKIRSRKKKIAANATVDILMVDIVCGTESDSEDEEKYH